MRPESDLRLAFTIIRGALFIPLLLAYTAASYLIFAIPSQRLLSLANVMFPLWDTGYSINIDLECAALISAILAVTYISVRRQGRKVALLRVVQYGGLSIFPLGLLILLSPSGYGFFFVQVSNIQPKYIPWSTWFTNEYLFLISLGLFISSTVLLRHHQNPGNRAGYP